MNLQQLGAVNSDS